jgi:hypothetical protein
MTSFYRKALNLVLLLFSIISPIKAPISIVASITAISSTAISNRYLRGRPLPRFSGSYSLALDND